METITESLSKQIRELRAHQPILSTTPTRVAIDSLEARIAVLENAVLMLSEALGERTKAWPPAADELRSSGST